MVLTRCRAPSGNLTVRTRGGGTMARWATMCTSMTSTTTRQYPGARPSRWTRSFPTWQNRTARLRAIMWASRFNPERGPATSSRRSARRHCRMRATCRLRSRRSSRLVTGSTRAINPAGALWDWRTASCTVSDVVIPDNPPPQTFLLREHMVTDTGGLSVDQDVESAAITVNLPAVAVRRRSSTKRGTQTVSSPAAPRQSPTRSRSECRAGRPDRPG